MKIIAFTGAGISKSAGIPTYEDLKGIKDELTVELKENEPERFAKAYSLLVNNVKYKEPTKAHKILAKLNIPIITMNVDTLHTKAGSKDVIELHGNYVDKNIVLYRVRGKYSFNYKRSDTRLKKRNIKSSCRFKR